MTPESPMIALMGLAMLLRGQNNAQMDFNPDDMNWHMECTPQGLKISALAENIAIKRNHGYAQAEIRVYVTDGKQNSELDIQFYIYPDAQEQGLPIFSGTFTLVQKRGDAPTLN